MDTLNDKQKGKFLKKLGSIELDFRSPLDGPAKNLAAYVIAGLAASPSPIEMLKVLQLYIQIDNLYNHLIPSPLHFGRDQQMYRRINCNVRAVSDPTLQWTDDSYSITEANT